MKKILVLVITVFSFINISCSKEDENNENKIKERRMDVTINGIDYHFNTFAIFNQFDDPNNKYYEITAKIDHEDYIVIDFEVMFGLTGNQVGDEIISKFEFFILDDNELCEYYALDTPFPNLNVTVNNEDKFDATFAFSKFYNVRCSNMDIGEEEFIFTNGSIYLEF